MANIAITVAGVRAQIVCRRKLGKHLSVVESAALAKIAWARQTVLTKSLRVFQLLPAAVPVPPERPSFFNSNSILRLA